MQKLESVNVLIVDDREDGLIAMEVVLQDLPHINILRAHSGHEALSYLPQHDFAVILLDVQMPELDGFETAKLIRLNHQKYKQTPIIFVTAISKDDQYIYKGYEAGAVDYLFKPFNPQILRSKVSIFVELFRKTQQLEIQSELIRLSERKEKYLKLAELEVENLKRYRNLANSIPHLLWKAHIDGSIEYVNQVWTEYTGLSLENSVGSGWQEAIQNEDLKNFLKSWIQAMGLQESFEIEARIRRSDGVMRWHWIRAVPEMKGDTVNSWLGTCTDIEDRKKTEEQLLITQKIAVSANIAKTNFLANMSHEIRTPMNAILGFTELMLNPKQSNEQRLEWVSTIRRNGQQLLRIIDEILDISKVEAGRLGIESIEVNIVSLLSDLYSFLNLQACAKGLSLEFILQSQIPESILTDPTRIRQILINLIGNAIKFTEKGKIAVSIEWLPVKEANQGQIQIQVIDTGVGIDPSHMDRLFQPFAQVDNSTTRRFGGTGLGLALSRKLAQALGGDVILLQSTPNIGSTFQVFISTERVNGAKWTDKLDLQLSEDINEKVAVIKSSHMLDHMRILVVDDAPDNQTILGYFLEAEGAQVDFADNGNQGVEKALAGDYNLVLMDIQMPDIDGYEATQMLRKQGYSTPIIALTAHAMKEERERSLKVGCSEHLTKPIDRRKLVSMVDQIVHGRKIEPTI